ncbi:MAG: hypothetical protein IKZ88_04895 [Neisseriaceae bacterium]|nr:hypothetical protein [Neisseriaceae bacterium]
MIDDILVFLLPPFGAVFFGGQECPPYECLSCNNLILLNILIVVGYIAFHKQYHGI